MARPRDTSRSRSSARLCPRQPETAQPPYPPLVLTLEDMRALQAAVPPQAEQCRLVLLNAAVLGASYGPLVELAYADCQAEGGMAKVFWALAPDADLHAHFERTCETQCVGMLLSTRGQALHCGGLLWLSEVIPGERATVGMWYAQTGPAALPGFLPYRISQGVMQWIFQTFGVERLMAQTIFPEAREHFIRACGAHVLKTTAVALDTRPHLQAGMLPYPVAIIPQQIHTVWHLMVSREHAIRPEGGGYAER